MKNKSLTLGLISVLSPAPFFVLTALWFWMWFFGIGMGFLNYEIVPEWILMISVLPLFVSPLLGLIGTVLGIVTIREKYSLLGIILSLLCIVENFVLIYGIYYLGSRF